MKVILNTESICFPLTGIGRYSFELTKALKQQPAIDDLRFFAHGRFLTSLEPTQESPSVIRPNRRPYIKQLLQKSPQVMELYRLIAERVRARGLKGHEDFIYHSPNFFLPPIKGPSVATFHDLSPFTWAHCHNPSKVHYMQKELRNTLLRADRLITDSQHTRQELADFFNYPLAQIDAVPLACADAFKPRSEAQSQSVLSQYDLQYQGYCLFVGTIEPRKNIISLLEAYERLAPAVRQRWPLILTGFRGWLSESIHQRIEKAHQQGWARYLGYVPSEHLPILYAGARLFAFPSYYEGFGLPVLEAMSSGVPVVCSNSSSLPEVSGGAALLHDPDDIESLTLYLQQGLEDSDWRDLAIAQGLTHSQQFSWQRCANETVAVYQQLATSFL